MTNFPAFFLFSGLLPANNCDATIAHSRPSTINNFNNKLYNLH